MMKTLTPPLPNDLAGEIAELKDRLDEAERARLTPADQKAARIRKRLEDKQLELAQIEANEATAIAENQRQMALAALEGIERDIQMEKSRLDTMKAQYAQLPPQIQAGEWRFGQLLRARAEARKQLEVR